MKTNIVDFSSFRKEKENLVESLLENLVELQNKSYFRKSDYLEAIQDCIDIVNITLSGSEKPYPFFKK